MIINLEELKKTYQFLEGIDKKEMAARIDRLMEALSLQVTS
jgi:hypothetical protein